MKMHSFLIASTLLFFSCSDTKKNQKKEPSPEKVDKIAETASLDGCYEMVISGDTAFMNLTQNADKLSGSLVYKRKEKDSNTGDVMLTKKDARAEGYYTFQSEGQTSVRQIIFKINGNSFAEGYGDIEMRNDTALFKYPNALSFEEKNPFNKVNCK